MHSQLSSCETRSRDDVSLRVRLTLSQSRNPAFDCVTVAEENGHIVLSGKLPSFYLKQVVQTIAGAVDGVRQLDNRVEVVRAATIAG